MSSEVKQINKSYAKNKKKINRMANKQTNDVRHVFGESGQFIRKQNKRVSQINKRAIRTTRRNTNRTVNQISRMGSGVEDAALQTLSALGLTGPMVNQAFGAGRDTTQNAINQTRIMGKGQVGTLKMMNANDRTVGSLLLGMNRGGMASDLGQIGVNKTKANRKLNRVHKQALEDAAKRAAAYRQYSQSYSGYTPYGHYGPAGNNYTSQGGSGGGSGSNNSASQAQTNLLSNIGVGGRPKLKYGKR